MAATVALRSRVGVLQDHSSAVCAGTGCPERFLTDPVWHGGTRSVSDRLDTRVVRSAPLPARAVNTEWRPTASMRGGSKGVSCPAGLGIGVKAASSPGHTVGSEKPKQVIDRKLLVWEFVVFCKPLAVPLPSRLEDGLDQQGTRG